MFIRTKGHHPLVVSASGTGLGEGMSFLEEMNLKILSSTVIELVSAF